jgi:hypothetical protein
MAEFQWWLLLVGLVAGGGLVAVVTMDGRRREEDLVGLERQAETTWIVDRLAGGAQWLDASTVESVLRLHREYLGLPPPDELIIEGGEPLPEDEARLADVSDGDPDGMPDEVRHDRGGHADDDLAGAREQQPPAGEEADTGPDGEQRGDR